jgi:hypothetical protein
MRAEIPVAAATVETDQTHSEGFQGKGAFFSMCRGNFSGASPVMT